MDTDTGTVIIVIGGWFVVGFLVALALGKIIREANELGGQHYQPSAHDNVLIHYFKPFGRPAMLQAQGIAPIKKTKKTDSKRAKA